MKKPKLPYDLLWREFHSDLVDSLKMVMPTDPAPTSPEGRLLSDLASALERYEKERFKI